MLHDVGMTLADYLREEHETAAAFARRVGVSRMTVSNWLRGASTPGGGLMERISRETGGKVQPNDFFNIEPPPGEGAAA